MLQAGAVVVAQRHEAFATTNAPPDDEVRSDIAELGGAQYTALVRQCGCAILTLEGKAVDALRSSGADLKGEARRRRRTGLKRWTYFVWGELDLVNRRGR